MGDTDDLTCDVLNVLASWLSFSFSIMIHDLCPQLVKAVSSWAMASTSDRRLDGSSHEDKRATQLASLVRGDESALDQVVQVMSEELAWAHSIHWTSKGFRCGGREVR